MEWANGQGPKRSAGRPDIPAQPQEALRGSSRARRALFVTDVELIQRLGVPEKIAYAAIHVLDRTRDSGFPQEQAIWGNRRYCPTVKQWLDRRYGVGLGRTRE